MSEALGAGVRLGMDQATADSGPERDEQRSLEFLWPLRQKELEDQLGLSPRSLGVSCKSALTYPPPWHWSFC